jgi:transcriptional regulator GlxA family with amidase domain
MTTSITEYINQIRIEKAKHLLANTNLRNFEIALNVGFMNEIFLEECYIMPYIKCSLLGDQ